MAFSRCICCSGRKVFPDINRNLYYYAEGGDVWDTLFDTEAMRPKMVLFSAQPPCADPAWSEVVTLMAPIATDIWSAWSGSAPGRRPEAYTALKRPSRSI